jgi:linoleoyl-CoA desaturase
MNVLAEVRQALVEQGLQRKATGRILTELGIHLALLVGGVVLFFAAASPLLKGVALIMAVAGSVGVGTNTHTSAHGATSERRWVNEALSLFGYPLLLGLSITYWRRKHNVAHHGSPNVEGVDPDHEFRPWFALASSQVSRSRFLGLYHRKIQGLVFMPVAALLMAPNMRVLGLLSTVGKVFKGPGRGGAALDLAALGAHAGLWWVLPWFFASPAEVIVLNVVRELLVSASLFAIFAPAHLPYECSYYARDAVPEDPILRQVATTIDFRVGKLASFFLAGLQYQVEHHLFPSVSHVHYGRLSRVVKEVLERNGYPYRQLGWGDALMRCARVAFHPKPQVAARGSQ